MPTAKQKANLKRGTIKGTPQTAARARAAKAEHAAEYARVGELARNDLGAALEEIAVTLARGLVRLHRRTEASGREPSRAVIDATREFRQTLEAVAVQRAAQGIHAEAESFFNELDTRVATILERVGSPQPAVEITKDGVSRRG